MSTTAVMVGILGLMGLILLMAYLLEEEHFLFKIFLYSMFFILIPVVVNMVSKMTDGTIYEASGLAFFKWGIRIQRIFWIYLFIYLIYKIFLLLGVDIPEKVLSFGKRYINKW